MPISRKPRHAAVRIDKAERFERLAEKRVTQVLRKLRLIGNLGNRHNYSYTEVHVKQIFDVLEAELRQTRARFRNESPSSDQQFSFKKQQ
jgi:hypothetical protein